MYVQNYSCRSIEFYYFILELCSRIFECLAKYGKEECKEGKNKANFKQFMYWQVINP